MREDQIPIHEIRIPVIPNYLRVFGEFSYADEEMTRIVTLNNVAAGTAFFGTDRISLDDELPSDDLVLTAERTMRKWYTKPRQVSRSDISDALRDAELKPVRKYLDSCLDVLRRTRRQVLREAFQGAIELGHSRAVRGVAAILASSQDPVMINYLIDQMTEYEANNASRLS